MRIRDDMKDHLFGTSLTPASKTHARVLLGVAVVMCALCITAIIVAEIFMPDNAAGQKGVLAFYRAFGPFLLIGCVHAGWAYAYVKRMD